MSRLALLLVLSSLGQAPADDPKLVRDLLDRQVADWNKGDLESFCEGYWKSPELVFQSGSSKSAGWQAMHDRYFKSYKSEGKAMGTLAFTDVEIQILAPDVAMARGRWGLTKLPDGKTPSGLFTLILRKFPGKTGWKIVHDHTSARSIAVMPPQVGERVVFGQPHRQSARPRGRDGAGASRVGRRRNR